MIETLEKSEIPATEKPLSNFNKNIGGRALSPEVQRALQHLEERIHRGEVQSGIDIKYLEGLREVLEKPGSINQGISITCTQSSLMYDLAVNNPEELTRIATALAVTGAVKLNGGATVTLNRQSLVQESSEETGPFQPRNIFEKSFQESLLNKFSKSGIITHEDGRVENVKGTTAQLCLEMRKQVLGDPTLIGIGSQKDLEAIVATMKSTQLSDINQQMSGTDFNLQMSTSGKDMIHNATIAQIVEENGQRFVDIYHGWGQTNVPMNVHLGTYDPQTGLTRMTIEEFSKRIVSMNLSNQAEVVKRLGLTHSLDQLSARMLPEDPMIAITRAQQALLFDASDLNSYMLEAESRRKKMNK